MSSYRSSPKAHLSTFTTVQFSQWYENETVEYIKSSDIMLLFESLRLEMESSIFPVWIEGSQLRSLDDKGITLTDEIGNVAGGGGQGRILCIKKTKQNKKNYASLW